VDYALWLYVRKQIGNALSIGNVQFMEGKVRMAGEVRQACVL
jgi:hypothetical protein